MELTSLVSSRAPTHSRKAAAFKSWLDIEKAAARAGLLHDLYLYDPADGSAHPGNQGKPGRKMGESRDCVEEIPPAPQAADRGSQRCTRRVW
mgnify:CR=1 FL=1